MEPTDLVTTRACPNWGNSKFPNCRRKTYPGKRKYCGSCFGQMNGLRVVTFRKTHPRRVDYLRSRLQRGSLLPIVLVWLQRDRAAQYWLISSMCRASKPLSREPIDTAMIAKLGTLLRFPAELLAPVKKLFISQHDTSSPVNPASLRMRRGFHLLALSPFAESWIDAADLHRKQAMHGQQQWLGRLPAVLRARFRAILTGDESAAVPQLPPLTRFYIDERLSGWHPSGVPFPFEMQQRETARAGIRLLAEWRQVLGEKISRAMNRRAESESQAVQIQKRGVVLTNDLCVKKERPTRSLRRQSEVDRVDPWSPGNAPRPTLPLYSARKEH
jgi:hypothetical protein